MTSKVSPRRVLETLMARNRAFQTLGLELLEVEAGRAKLAMPVTETMGNSHGTCHGGFLFALADQTAGFACMSRNEAAVTQSAHVTYVSAGPVGQTLTAEGVEVTRSKRNGTYDVRVTGAEGQLVALIRYQFLITGAEIVPSAG